MVLELIKERYSVRKYASIRPSEEVISRILEAGRLAPSWINIQPWHFIVIRDPETKDLLSQLAHGQQHVAQAPVVIACCGDMSAWETEKFKRILEARPEMTEVRMNTLLNSSVYNPTLIDECAVRSRTLEELTYAISYMTLEAQEQGLGCCIAGAIGNEFTRSLPDIYAKVRERLNLPEHLFLATLLLIGYPELEVTKPKKIRKSPEDVISYERFKG